MVSVGGIPTYCPTTHSVLPAEIVGAFSAKHSWAEHEQYGTRFFTLVPPEEWG